MLSMTRAILIGAMAACCTALYIQSAAAITPEDTAQDVSRIRHEIDEHMPYKQYDLESGRPNYAIGKTPGATCEAVSFKVRSAPAGSPLDSKTLQSINWVYYQQYKGPNDAQGAVASTPDLPSPSNHYYYAIDAAFCGKAMLEVYDRTHDRDYLNSAVGFGNFLLRAEQHAGRHGLCENLVINKGAAWNCQVYTKNLLALPFLSSLSKATGNPQYAAAAGRVRASLAPALSSFWEYADKGQWHRIEGPHHERDWFIYGDTVAYGLAGLYAYEGASPLVRKLYADATSLRGRSGHYEPRIALAGYIHPGRWDAGDGAIYYDLVTLGLLQPLRREIAPADYQAAREVLYHSVMPSSHIGWHMSLDKRVKAKGNGDISTLASIGNGLLD